LRFWDYGNPEKVLKVETIETPARDETVATIQINAAGINPSDVKNVTGGMHNSTLPRTPGRDFSGVVVEGPREWIGKKVWGTGGDIGFTRDGSHSEFLHLPNAALIERPLPLSDDEAATSALTFVTAYLCFLAGAPSNKTKSVVVIGAAGGVGNAALQICRFKGLKTFGLVRKATDVEALSRLGYESFATDVHEPLEGLRSFGLEGVDLVIDAVGGNMMNVAFSILNQRGRIVEIAAPVSQRKVTFDLIDFYHREASLIGVDSRSYTVEQCAGLLNELAPMFVSGIIRTQPVEPISLDEAINAYAQIASGQSSKRFSIHPNG
jgi:NADPH2:quinone reductase